MIKCAIMSCFLTNPIKIRVYSFDQMNDRKWNFSENHFLNKKICVFFAFLSWKHDFEQKRFICVIAHFFVWSVFF